MFGQSDRASADSAFQAPRRPPVREQYDSRTDSTRLSVITHEGDFVFIDASPRLVWSVTYAGRVPAPPGAETVVLEMRTQSPLVAANGVLVMDLASGQHLEYRSVGSRGEPAMLTAGSWMRFLISTGALAALLADAPFRLTIGGVPLDLAPQQVDALRELLARAAGAQMAPAESAGN
jgi:hypothetical protein